MLLTGWIVTTPSIIQCWDVTTAPDDPTETIVAGHTKATNRDFAVRATSRTAILTRHSARAAAASSRQTLAA